MWSAMIPFRRFDTLNQMIEALGQRRLRCLAIDPQALPDAPSLAAILETAHRYGVPVVLLTHYLQPTLWHLTVVNRPDAWASLWTMPSCVQLWPAVAHHGDPVSLTPRLRELLAIFATYPGRILTLSAINAEAVQRGVRPWTAQNLRTVIAALNQRLLPPHVQTRRHAGYLFTPCSPNREFVEPGGAAKSIDSRPPQ